MARVRYLQGMGLPKGPAIQPGDVREVDAEEAERLIASHIAVEAKGESLSSAADEFAARQEGSKRPRSKRASKATSKKAETAETAEG